MDLNPKFWKGKKVFLTGHTGFKGAWLSLWLAEWGAEVTGFSLEVPTQPSLFDVARVGERVHDLRGDIRDQAGLAQAMQQAAPDIVIHMAAQSLVRLSYQAPVETYSTNVMGTVNLLEAARQVASVRTIVVVTSDKCYDNREWSRGYVETDAMGGRDPYSSSKGCQELVTAAYRASFYTEDGQALVASARAGNVIGGGDWAADRLVPDAMRAFALGDALVVRNPRSIRPWQHVLEPLSGYLLLAQRLSSEGRRWAGGWNFGPLDEDAQPVETVVNRLTDSWGNGAHWTADDGPHPHEAVLLKLDCAKARNELGWTPKWRLARAVDAVVDWHRAMLRAEDMQSFSLQQIRDYCA